MIECYGRTHFDHWLILGTQRLAKREIRIRMKHQSKSQTVKKKKKVFAIAVAVRVCPDITNRPVRVGVQKHTQVTCLHCLGPICRFTLQL